MMYNEIMVCQKCQKEVKNPVAVFCYWCGAVLEHPTNTTSTVENPKTESKTPKVKINKRLMLGTLPFVATALIITTLFTFKVKPFNKQSTSAPVIAEISPESQENKIKTQVVELEDTNLGDSFSFGVSKFESLIPQDIIYYIEGTNINDQLTAESQKKFEVLLTDIFDLSQEEALTYFSSDFGYFCNGEGCAILLLAKDAKSLKAKAEDTTFKPDGFSLELLDNTALIYQDEDVKNAVVEVYQHLSKSLDMDSKYLTTLKEIPTKGLFMAYVGKSDNLGEELLASDLELFKSIPESTIEKITTYMYCLDENNQINFYYK